MQLQQVHRLALALLAVAAASSATAVVREDVEGIRRVQLRDDSKNDFFDSNPQYDFSYRIHDAVTGDAKDHVEERHGGLVLGSYSLVEPDGTLRHVKYTADDENGFNAVVTLTPGHSPPIPTPLRSINQRQGVVHNYVDAPVPVQHPASGQQHHLVQKPASEINRRVHVEHNGPVVQHHHVIHQVPVVQQQESRIKDSVPQPAIIHHHTVHQVPVVHHGVHQPTTILSPVQLMHDIPLVYHLQHGVPVQHKQEAIAVGQQHVDVRAETKGVQHEQSPSVQQDGVVQQVEQEVVNQDRTHQQGTVVQGAVLQDGSKRDGVVQQDVTQDIQQQHEIVNQEILHSDAQRTGVVSGVHTMPQVIEVRHSIQRIPTYPPVPDTPLQQRSIDGELQDAVQEQEQPLHQRFVYMTSGGGNYIKFNSPYASYEVL